MPFVFWGIFLPGSRVRSLIYRLPHCLVFFFSCAANGAQSETTSQHSALLGPRWATICCGPIRKSPRVPPLNQFSRSSRAADRLLRTLVAICRRPWALADPDSATLLNLPLVLKPSSLVCKPQLNRWLPALLDASNQPGYATCAGKIFHELVALFQIRSLLNMPSNLPRVENGYTGCLEMAHIPGHNRHAVNERSRCDESIPIRARIWHMQRRASMGHHRIDRQNSSGK